MPQARSVSMLLVLTIRTGILLVAWSRVRARVAWKPLMPVSTTSIRTRSGSSLRAISRPSSALVAKMTWWPPRSSHCVKTARSVGESSISRIRAMLLPAPRSGVYVGTDCSEQFFPREWLGEVLLGTDDAAARLVEQAILGGQHDHRRRLEFLVALDQRAGLIAVQARHHDVDEDDLRLLVGDLGKRLETVARGDDLAALALEQGLGGTADGLGIVDDHDPQATQCPGWSRVVCHYPVSPCARRFFDSRRRCVDVYIPVPPQPVKPDRGRRRRVGNRVAAAATGAPAGGRGAAAIG